MIPRQNNINLPQAEVAELADALDSKSSVPTDVWVRVPPSAYKQATIAILAFVACFVFLWPCPQILSEPFPPHSVGEVSLGFGKDADAARKTGFDWLEFLL